jgi:hypothetical protein
MSILVRLNTGTGTVWQESQDIAWQTMAVIMKSDFKSLRSVMHR